MSCKDCELALNRRIKKEKIKIKDAFIAGEIETKWFKGIEVLIKEIFAKGI
jgi:hypothetical protein